MSTIRTRVGKGGRVVIPAEYRKSLGLKPGDEVLLVLEKDEVRLVTLRQAVERAQSLVRRYVPRNRSLVDELLEERREEASHA